MKTKMTILIVGWILAVVQGAYICATILLAAPTNENKNIVTVKEVVKKEIVKVKSKCKTRDYGRVYVRPHPPNFDKGKDLFFVSFKRRKDKLLFRNQTGKQTIVNASAVDWDRFRILK